jgi:AcrR family transcriptional regulator
VLLERGLDAPIDDIARRAGVGVGTIYRRFGDRDALIREIVLSTVTSIAASAVEARSSHTDPWTAFAQFVGAAFHARLGLLASALFPVMSQLHRDEAFLAQRQTLLDAVDGLLARAQAADVVRGDVGIGDVLMAIAKASRPLPGVPANVDMARHDRTAALVLDSLRAGDQPQLPGRPLLAADLDRALSIKKPR